MIGNRNHRLGQQLNQLMTPALPRRQLPNLNIVREQVSAIGETANLGLQRKEIGIVTEALPGSLNVINPVNLPPRNLEKPDTLKVANAKIPTGDHTGIEIRRNPGHPILHLQER